MQWDNEGRQHMDVDDFRRRSSSFFFTSFLEDLEALDMYETFQSYGAIDEVVIPSKKD